MREQDEEPLNQTETELRVKLLNLPPAPEPAVSDFHVFSGRRGSKRRARIKGLDHRNEIPPPPRATLGDK